MSRHHFEHEPAESLAGERLFRLAARRVARRAIDAALYGRVTDAESLWRDALQTAIKSLTNRAYSNGIKDGRKKGRAMRDGP